LRIKEQETHLILNEHDDDDDILPHFAKKITEYVVVSYLFPVIILNRQKIFGPSEVKFVPPGTLIMFVKKHVDFLRNRFII
jgi:hypothetical protein